MGGRSRTGEPVTFETEYIARDGEKTVFEARTGAIREGAQVVALTVICRDMTARKQAEEQLRDLERRFRTLFEQVADPVFLVNAESRIIEDCNTAASEMLGYSRDELTALRVEDIDVSETPGFVATVVREVVSSGKAEFKTRFRLKSGEIRNLDIKLRGAALGGKMYVLCTRTILPSLVAWSARSLISGSDSGVSSLSTCTTISGSI